MSVSKALEHSLSHDRSRGNWATLNARLGESAVAETRKLAAVAGVAWLVVAAAFRPRFWSRTVRQALVVQIVVSGVGALGIVGVLALAIGVLLCVQYQVLVGQFGQSQILAPLFVIAIVRELGSLLVNFVLISRSGNTIATELALLNVSGEVRVLEGQGIDPFAYLLYPRVLGLCVSAACLNVLFLATSLAGLYLCAEWFGVKTGSAGEFAGAVLGLVTPADVVNVTLKGTVPALIIGSICFLEGANVGENLADVPRAARRAAQRSMLALFATSALISVVTSLR